MPKLKKPSFKMKQFAKKYIEYKGNGAKAALAVYDTDKKNAKNVAHITLKKDAVQEEIKSLLNKAGLDTTTLIDYTKDSIEENLQGKPSQSVAADLIKFLYKLHNVVPANRNVSSKLNINVTANTNIDQIKENLTKSNVITQSLLDDLSSS